MHPETRQLACAAQHFGHWAVNARWLNSAVSAFNAGQLPRLEPRVMQGSVMYPKAEGLPKTVYLGYTAEGYPNPLYTVDATGAALVSIQGQITKGESSFGGASSVRTRQALRAAEVDPDVSGIMLAIDSPGGTVAGTMELADEVYRIATAGRVPIVTHVEGMMESAGLWIGAQSKRVTASAMSEIGSIGVVCVVEDLSKAAEAAGVKVHVVSTGPMKGAFAPGTEVTPEQLASLQTRVDEINTFFIDAVKRGRNMSTADVRKLATGEDWLAAEAKSLGLIDKVATFEEAMAMLRKDMSKKAPAKTGANPRASQAQRLRMLELE